MNLMKRPDLSVCLDDLGLDAKSAMVQARRLGFGAVDVGATAGTISPGELSETGRRHLLRHLSDLGLRLGSLRGPVSGEGYGSGVGGERRLDSMRAIIRMASELRVPVVSTTLGRAGPTDPEGESRRIRDALTVLADDADHLGVTVALETSGQSAKAMQSLLSEINCAGLAACCDTGAMLMRGDDPHAVAETLPGRIGLVRARDAVSGTSENPGYEVSPGQGHLDSPRLLAALFEAGFGGTIVLSRTCGENAASDLAAARRQFEEFLPG